MLLKLVTTLVLLTTSVYGCQTENLRLVGGHSNNEGRVEICIGNQWGTVCDDLWGTADARVVCRQLGLPVYGARAFSSAFFGQGTGPILLDDVECTGSERTLLSCSLRRTHNCGHYEDAGVRCQSQVCHNGNLRLVGGQSNNEGRVEICIGNQWGTVCDDSWGTADARVVCRQLGFSVNGSRAFSSAFFGEGTGPILLDDVQCRGSERTLLSCSRRQRGHNCGHHEDAGVRCQADCQNGNLRLVGGQSNNEGRVEICIENQWGTVCDDSWGTADARVVCRQLGLPVNGALAFSLAFFGQGTGPILLDDVECTGSERTLLSCSLLRTHNCDHSEDAGVRCRTVIPVCQHGALRLVGGQGSNEGRVEICIGNQWGTVCDDSWGTADARVVCRQLGLPVNGARAFSSAFFGQGTGPILLDDVQCTGSERTLLSCSLLRTHNCGHSDDAGVRCLPQVIPVCQNGTLRLVGGSSSNEGRVEICIGNQWGTVCDDSWGTADARVVCRQLGLPVNGALAFSNAFFGQGTGPILLDNVECTGSERTLLSCSLLRTHNCGHSDDAGVRCPTVITVCQHGTLRLVGGQNTSEGRVEICIGNQWGTVCDDSWGTADARVVCRQLGFSVIGALAFSSAFFGQGTGPILLDDVECTGSERTLLSCSLRRTHNCGHSEDAGVRCLPQVCQNGALRLVGGQSNNEGRVEICIGNQWGTVCDDSWGTADARVVCRQLGLPVNGARAFSSAFFGQGTGPILLDDVECTGSEHTLLSCSRRRRSHNCGHSEDAGVRCQPHGAPIAGIVAGSLVGLAVIVIATICICVCVVYYSKSTTTTHVPRTTTVTQPQSFHAQSSHTNGRSAVTTNFTTTTSFTTTSPSTLTAQPPPSYATSSQYSTVDSSKAPQQPPPSYEYLYKPSYQQPLDPNSNLSPAPYPESASPPPYPAPDHSTYPPNPYPSQEADNLPN